MANPRKFSEKIALHNQKQAEGDAEFKRILEEVSGAIKGASPQNRLNVSQNEPINNQFNNGAEQQAQTNHISLQQTHQQQLIQQQHQLYNDQNGQNILLINQQQTSSNHLSPNNILTSGCRADSLPNGVNNLTADEKSRSSIDLRSALNNLNEMTQSTQGDLKKSNSRNRMPSPNNHLSRHQQQMNQSTASQRQQSQHQQYQQYNGSYNEFNLTANIPTQSRSQINLHSYASQINSTNDQQFVHKSNHHNSHRINPYYLSAPESNWRRTNSDSALNQTTIYCEQQQQQQLNQQQIYQQQNQLNQNQIFDLQQRQKQVIIQQMTSQEMNKCDNQLNNQLNNQQTSLAGNNLNSSWDPGKQRQSNGNQQQSPQTTGAQQQAPVISINYNNQQQNTFSSSINNNTSNVQPIYTSSTINPNVQCTQTNYVNNMNSIGNDNYTIQQRQNGKRPKSCDQETNAFNNNQFNRTNANLVNNQISAQNRNQLPTLQFQSSSQNNLNQLNDQTTFTSSNSNHHSSVHVNTNQNTDSSANFLYANTNTCSGSLPDLNLFDNNHHQPVIPLDQDALSSGLNSNDNSNNSNQSALSNSSYQFSGITSSSVPCSSVLNSPMNYRANQNNNNFVQYNCSNPNSSNSNSPLHQNAFTNSTSAQQMINQQQPMNVVSSINSNINSNDFTNKIQDNNKFINQQITNNQLANQFHNHHISSPVRPSSVESTDDSGVIFNNQLTGNDMLINELENDENIEQFDFDLFNNQDSQNDKLITNDQTDKLNCDLDTNNNDTNNLVNSFYQDTNQLMNHRNVSTPSENASSPNSPASSILNLNSPVSSPTAVSNNQSNNATSVQINSICKNNLANMNLNNDNNLSQNSTILPNKNDFLINETDCMITNDQMDTAETNGHSKDKNGIVNEDYLQLDTFGLNAFDSNKTDHSQYLNDNENCLNNKDQDLILNYDLNTSTGIPNIIVWPEHREHNGDLSSIDELTY